MKLNSYFSKIVAKDFQINYTTQNTHTHNLLQFEPWLLRQVYLHASGSDLRHPFYILSCHSLQTYEYSLHWNRCSSI
eukprot:m.69917 g.69917  ORF g.69917 m.69917 type:complete len:77 (+) comp11651_c0_seq1:407-637(+)